MDLNIDDLDKLVEKVMNFDHMYQHIRVIDPLNKRVLYVRDKKADNLVEVCETCHDVWNKGEICKNCISMRAYNENDTFIKVDTTLDKIIMATAIPVRIKEETLVVELLKDVTNSMVLDNTSLSDNGEVARLLEQANIAAVTDELTKIFNKRYIIEKLPVDILAAKLQNSPLSVLMADIDHFKKINDNYGHLAGDYILREFAGILKANIRDNKDWLARFGGEEFVVTLTVTDREAALQVAERLRKAVEENEFIYNGQIIKITASFGICTIDNDDDGNYESLIACSDRNLYIAKNSGRNKSIA